MRILLALWFLVSFYLNAIFGDGSLSFERYDNFISVKYDDALKSMQTLKVANVTDYRPLIVDLQRKQLFVGARDIVLRLSMDNLAILERFDWPASSGDIGMCQIKGQTEADCRNFIRLLALKGDRILICGTNAYYPACTWRKATELNFDNKEHFNGVGYAPYSPRYSNTYVMTDDGDLYTGVVTDFAGHDTSLLRMIPSNKILRTPKANSRWLNDPNFVSALEIGNFIYFFFREVPLEAAHCGGKTMYSRVGRVCKNDVGGDILLQDQWTTFSKARLNCSYSSSTADLFDYNYLQSIHFVPEQSLLYAVFTTAESRLSGSAICAFSLASLRKAFGGPYKYQSSPNTFWQTEPNGDPDFNCQIKGAKSDRPSMTTRSLSEAQKFQLMDSTVQPVSALPLDDSVLEKYMLIVVDVISLANRAELHVLFVATKDGLLKKYSLVPGAKRACLTEVVQLTQQKDQIHINEMKLISDLGVIVITTNERVLKINVQRCSRFKTKRQCLDARDPYCGWDNHVQVCTTSPPPRSTSLHLWEQNLGSCEKVDSPVDGQFSEWSAWFACPRMSSEQGEGCQCRQRSCNNPRPRNGGALCAGPTIQVSNCTQHGGWTSWSDWSACTKTCGNAVRTRTRDCSNPAPAFGGLVCVGGPMKMETCDVPQCPEAVPTPVHGSWSEWGEFEPCSKSCNGGVQKRSRACDNPAPAHGGGECPGCDNDYRPCNMEQCPELRRWSGWTPWLQANATPAGGVILKRYRVACEARVENAGLLSMTNFRSEEKICSKGGADCTDTTFRATDGGWSEWSEWSSCSQSCGTNGTQWRSRTCTKPSPSGNGLPCSGHAKELRQCNVVSCESSWSCWRDYTACSVTCGTGYRERVRDCVQPSPSAKNCVGNRTDKITCDAGPCSSDGYGEWSSWSVCTEFGLKVRLRSCVAPGVCRGSPDAQMRRCYEKGNALESRTTPTSSSNVGLILGVIGAFVGGALLATLGSFYLHRRRTLKVDGEVKVPLRALNGCANGVKHPQPPKIPPPTPSPPKSNIYTPPPSLRNIHPVPNITLNPLNRFSDCDVNDYEGLSDVEASLTLKRTMRTSLHTKDYL